MNMVNVDDETKTMTQIYTPKYIYISIYTLEESNSCRKLKSNS